MLQLLLLWLLDNTKLVLILIYKLRNVNVSVRRSQAVSYGCKLHSQDKLASVYHP